MTADRWSDLVALLAGVIGLFVVLRAWPRVPRQAQVARLRHPSAPMPVGVALDTSGDTAHWRVSTSAASVPTTVDILTWRPVGSVEWRSEPIVEPLALDPGRSALLPLDVDDPTSPHIVVVAWTVRHPGGDVQGSRTLTIGKTSSTVPVAAPANRRWALPVAATLVAGLLVVLVLVAGWRVLDSDAAGDGSATSTGTTVPLIEAPGDPTVPPTVANSTSTLSDTVTSAGATTTTTASTFPTPTAVSTVPTPTTSTTSPSTSPSTSTSPTSPTSSSTAAPDSDGRTIEVQGRVEDCRFGADCVIVSFAAVGFPGEGDYVCEFADGSRETFRYAGGGALDACAASGEQPSVTIEIDGVRSPTVTREAPQGI